MADFFVNKGEEILADLWDGVKSNTTISWFLGWGTGSPAAATSIALVTASSEARTEATIAGGELTQPAVNQNRIIATITSTQTQSITEMGVFTASSGGDMLIHSSFAAIALVNTDAIQFTVTITYAGT